MVVRALPEAATHPERVEADLSGAVLAVLGRLDPSVRPAMVDAGGVR